MIVVDASAILEVLLHTPSAAGVSRRLFAARETLHAPHLLDLEVAQALRRYWLWGELTPERGLEALADLADFPLIRYQHDLFLHRIWELRRNVTAYDAAYLALAEALDARLVTRDKALAASSGHVARIELV
jgi:predicted nucleic acid-binding protein